MVEAHADGKDRLTGKKRRADLINRLLGQRGDAATVDAGDAFLLADSADGIGRNAGCGGYIFVHCARL